MSPNPKAPRRYRQANETVGQLDQFLGRLARLGADAEQLAQVREHWDRFDGDWTPEARAQLLATPDRQLAGMVRQVDAEYTDATIEPGDGPDDTALGYALTEAGDRIGQSVQALLTWVGGNPVRAYAVLDAERQAAAVAGRAERRTLVGPLSGFALPE